MVDEIRYGNSLEHVLHVFGVDERVVDGHHVHHGVLQGRAQNKASDPAEAVDAHAYGSHRLWDAEREAAITFPEHNTPGGFSVL